MKIHAMLRAATRFAAAALLCGGPLAATGGPAQARTSNDRSLAPETSPLDRALEYRYQLENTYRSTCLDAAFGNTSDFSPMLDFSCTYDTFQKWRLTYTGVPLTYTVQSVHSGKCLDVPGASKDDLAPIVQYGCDGRASQRWRFTCGFGSNECTIQNGASGKCLDALGKLHVYGLIVQNECQRPHQTWRIIYDGRY